MPEKKSKENTIIILLFTVEVNFSFGISQRARAKRGLVQWAVFQFFKALFHIFLPTFVNGQGCV